MRTAGPSHWSSHSRRKLVRHVGSLPKRLRHSSFKRIVSLGEQQPVLLRPFWSTSLFRPHGRAGALSVRRMISPRHQCVHQHPEFVSTFLCAIGCRFAKSHARGPPRQRDDTYDRRIFSRYHTSSQRVELFSSRLYTWYMFCGHHVLASPQSISDEPCANTYNGRISANVRSSRYPES